jgi:hypothetical protein
MSMRAQDPQIAYGEAFTVSANPARRAARPTQQQHRAMHALWREAGVTDRADRLALAGASVGRPLATSNDLSEAEADELIAYMRRLNRAGLLATTASAFLARSRPPEAPAGTGVA